MKKKEMFVIPKEIMMTIRNDQEIDMDKIYPLIKPFIDCFVTSIVKDYLSEFLVQPDDYLKNAVRRESDGGIDEKQKQIHDHLNPLVLQTIELLNASNTNPPQKRIMEAVIRERIFFHTALLIEKRKLTILMNRYCGTKNDFRELFAHSTPKERLETCVC